HLGVILDTNVTTHAIDYYPCIICFFFQAEDGIRDATVTGVQTCALPIFISVDAKKKELVGDFKNAGRQWRPTGQPEPVRVHDFLIPERGKAIPYGVYDLTRNAGWVGVGIDHDRATFAAQRVGRRWRKLGRLRYRRDSC